MHLRLPGVPSGWLTRDILSRGVPRKRAGSLDFAAQPAGRGIETVRPGRRAILEEYAFEIRGITQGFDHGSALCNNGGEVVLAGHAVAERRAEAMSAERLDFCDFNHRPGLRS